MKGEKRVKQTGEVFTPRSLIREMLDALPNSVWFDPNKRWLEPAAGDGNFLVEIKARLLQAGHNERHILENMLFSVELIDDNHWVLQHRLGYLVDGQPNPKFWPNGENFEIGKIHRIAQDLNGHNPYNENLGLERDEVLFHRNHVCTTALEYDMSFGRTTDESTNLPQLPERDLGPWPETDTPDIGEKYVVEKMLGRQPQLAETPKPPKELKHKHVNKVDWGWENADEIPAPQEGYFQLYAILNPEKQVWGIGMSRNMRQRIPNGYAYHIRTMEPDGSLIIKQMQDIAVVGGNQISFTAKYLETVQGKRAALERESELAEQFRAEGHPVLNSTKPILPKKEKISRSKEPKAIGGGWSVHPKYYGTGKIVETMFNGEFWVADHDALIDDINASLKSKGKKTLFEEPRAFGASSGIRGGPDGGLFRKTTESAAA